MLTLADVAGHISFLFIAAGMVLLGRRNPLGFLSQALGSAVWIVVGYFLGLSSIFFWNILFLIIAVNGYYNLKRQTPEIS